MRRKSIAIAAALLFSCTAVQQQKAQPPAPDDLHFHNLQVLPQNITRDQLITTMRRFTQALGVGCDYCHVPVSGSADEAALGMEPTLDFRADAKEEKNTARVMLRMTDRINRGYIARVPDAHTVVTCWTCHRGEAQPAIVPSLPPQPER